MSASSLLTALRPVPTRADRVRRATVTGLALLMLAFPFLGHGFQGLGFDWDIGDDDVDSVANALAYATLALGLNIVVGFAGLLDLGYAAFFAIGAYTYGCLTAFQVMPVWSSFWEPFAALGLVAKYHQQAGDLVHFTVSFWLACRWRR